MAEGLVGYSLTPCHLPESLCEIFTEGFQGECGMKRQRCVMPRCERREALTIAQGFGDLQPCDRWLRRKIGECARHAQDPVIAAGREIHRICRFAQELEACSIRHGNFFEQAPSASALLAT